MATTYRNDFRDHNGNVCGPPQFTTDAPAVPYRGFLLFERMKMSARTKYGEVDAVFDGTCLMITCTIEGARERIDDLLDASDTNEVRAVRRLKEMGYSIRNRTLTLSGRVKDLFD